MTTIVSLSDVRTHLRYPAGNTSDDTALQRFIGAAGDVIRAECGEILLQQYDEYYDGGDYALYLRHVPVNSVEAVIEGWGWIDYTLAEVEVNTVPASNLFAYSLDMPEVGKVTRRTAGNVPVPFQPGEGNVQVTYTAGRATIPSVIQLACLELIAHWWQNSQQRASSGAGMQFDAVNMDYTRAEGISTINQGVPYRILEMIRPYRRLPVIG